MQAQPIDPKASKRSNRVGTAGGGQVQGIEVHDRRFVRAGYFSYPFRYVDAGGRVGKHVLSARDPGSSSGPRRAPAGQFVPGTAGDHVKPVKPAVAEVVLVESAADPASNSWPVSSSPRDVGGFPAPLCAEPFQGHGDLGVNWQQPLEGVAGGKAVQVCILPPNAA